MMQARVPAVCYLRQASLKRLREVGWRVGTGVVFQRPMSAWHLACWACLVLWLCAQDALANAPPAAPVLRVEAGMHVNVTRAVAVDAAGRWAVTASDDKTARVWSLPDGAAGPVLRVPIAEGGAQAAEGRLHAVVITADGATVAVAGRSGSSFGGSNAVYVFERASGRMLRRIDTASALPVVTLALTPDGRFLAVGLGDDGGLKTFDFASGRQVHHDTKFAGSVYALDFRADGRVLAAGALDGVLRVYKVEEGRLALAGTSRPQDGKLIAQARFSPDGELIALGLEDSPQVLVLDGRTLQVVGTPAPAADGASAFSSLAWSPDGRELWGGGTHREGGQWLLRVWPRSNWAQFADRPVSGASVLALATLPGQRVLYVSGEPAWGIVDATAQVQRRWQSPLASFNSMARQFQVSADGRKLRFWYGFRQPLVEFDLATRVLGAVPDTVDGLLATGLAGPITESREIMVDGWENRRGTGFNGRRLPIGELETSRSLSIASDGQRFALGTDERLWLFDAQGKVLWSQRSPSLVWATHLTADGKMVLTAGQDGVIRWYRARDGSELLALFPHADRKRWVMWTPSGYFDAAAGAEELLGWHINRGVDASADFHPMWTLRARFRRADIIDRLLAAQEETTAVQQANAAAGRPAEPTLALVNALPPVLEITGAPKVSVAADGQTGEARLVVRLRSLPEAPVTALRVRADGRPAQVETLGAARPLAGAPGTEERDVRVRFNGRPEQLQLLAENRHGMSAAAALQIPWPAGVPAASSPAGGIPVLSAGAAVAGTAAAALAVAPAALAAAALASTPAPMAAAVATVAVPAAAAQGAVRRQPRLYILAIGVGKFTSPEVPPLDLPAKDATDFVAAMKTQQGKLYRSVDVQLLTDAQATRDNVVKGMEWLQREVTQHDVGMLFVAGHGMNDPTQGYLFVPHNFDYAKVQTTSVSHKQFKTTTENLAGKALFFIDTCHSGNVLGKGKKNFANPDVSAVINDLASDDTGVVVFSASTGRQEALENSAWGNGAFTKSLVEGLTGKADERNTGRVTYRMLDFYITDRVKELTKGLQSAVTVAPGGVPDFPLALLR
jgi:WD40 repeat protein